MESARSGFNGRTIHKRWLILFPLVFPIPGAAFAQDQLGTQYECRDGQVRDIAAQADAADGTDITKRAWIAQGRVRMAVRMSDRQRMPNEDKKFANVFSSYPWAAPTKYESVIAVEVNEGRSDGRKYLYTLTESALYRQQISNPYSPTNPGNGKWLPLVDPCDPPPPPGMECPYGDHLQNWEEMRDIKIWNFPSSNPAEADKGKILLLTDKRIVVIKDRKANIEFQSSANDLFNQGQYGTFVATGLDYEIGAINEKGVFGLRTIRVANDGDAWRAFVTAEISSREVGPGRDAYIVMACDLDEPNDFAHPTFDNKQSQSGGSVYMYWGFRISCG